MRAEKTLGSMPCVCMMMALCVAVQGCSGSTGTIPGTQGATGGGTSNATGGKSSTGGTIGSGGAGTAPKCTSSQPVPKTGDQTATLQYGGRSRSYILHAPSGLKKIDDVGFLKAIIEKLNAETCIDVRRIYVSGFSNGGGLAHRMGCDAADVIAAIAPTATDLRTQPCNAARPISMMEIKGMVDSLEPYEGGVVGPAGSLGFKVASVVWSMFKRQPAN